MGERCRQVADQHHFIPWSVPLPRIFALRQDVPTFITRTAGVYTGQEDLISEIMGNSDTGHQQIFNLTAARQVPRYISDMIRTGEFFRNDALNQDLCRVKDGARVVFKTLLSGQHGDDGYVHSAWPHMEAFFELYFKGLGLPASGLRVEAVLDGRDSPGHSSLVEERKEGRKRYGFLLALRRLLRSYDAEECLGWILGRQFMDRDYKGAMIRVEYEALTRNAGRCVSTVDDAFELVRGDHASGLTDPMVPPICIGPPSPVNRNTVFFNGIFRADRQEPITAALLGARDFVTRQATQKRKLDTWEDFVWFRDLAGIRHWSMVQYNQEFDALGSRCVFQDRPHEHNVLHLLTRKHPDFRFLFLTEGVKEKHMGLFSRGRRSAPLVSETQRIIPSYGRDQGVGSDNELYLFPQMRHPEIAKALVEALTSNEYDLVAVNFPGPDMLGHLVQQHPDACRKTLLSLEELLPGVLEVAEANGWTTIVTSDHGNIEHYGPDHGNNDVLTSLVLPAGCGLEAVPPEGDSARLFDIACTVLATLGTDPEAVNAPPIPPELAADPHRLVGRSLVRGNQDMLFLTGDHGPRSMRSSNTP